MRPNRDWLLPCLLAGCQLAVWPGVPVLRGDAPAAGPVAVALATTVLVAVALAVRRGAPVAALTGVLLGLTVGHLATPVDALLVLSVADLVALFSVAVHRSHRVTAIAVLACTAREGVLSWHQLGAVLEYVALLVLAALVYLAVAGLGRGRRRWRLARDRAAERLARAEADRQRAATVERHRLARELHDVSAHHLTAIVVTVTAARRLADRRPELTTQALGFAADTGRETLAALRQLVTVLRDVERQDGTPLAERILDLAAGFRRLGQPITVESDLPPAGPPPAATEAAYGIVREALTNALRYAPGAPVRVRLGYGPTGLDVDVVNAGPRPSASDDGNPPSEAQTGGPGSRSATAGSLGSGRGLAGAAGRAAELGGRLSAGPAPAGGWRVHAILPAAEPLVPAGPVAASDDTMPPDPGRDSAEVGAARRLRPATGLAGWLTARSRLRGARLADVIVVAGCVVFPLGLSLAGEEPPAEVDPVGLALLALLLIGRAAPLLLRRRAPWLALGAALLAALPWPLVIGLDLLPELALFGLMFGACVEVAAVYAVGRYATRRGVPNWLAVPVAAGGFAVVAAATVAAAGGTQIADPEASTLALFLATFFAAVLVGFVTALLLTGPLLAAHGVGRAMRRRHDRVDDQEHDALAAATARVVAEVHAERIRIGHGLHEAVLRDTARLVAAADPVAEPPGHSGPAADASVPPSVDGEPAGAESRTARLDAVAAAARAALAGMRELLSGLHDGPQPALAALADLCARYRNGGRPVDLDRPADPPRIPAAVELSAYRLVEGALGAGDPDPARVRLDYRVDGLAISVSGVPSATAGPVAAGLAARAAGLGGSITTGPGTVDLWLPTVPTPRS
ncbi:hypothetical protein E0H26_08275 [Micromonospora zingiberis]|uniref:histidine kinase n=1 Tax=Micromonospora zingiberis TaxID=2053011 RepID=A0A4R0GPB7_9ACTN|nr:histidine kinase [Micromonospora zingiberis]TCB98373.1 hypothetical protein E0H26_08275 [Micromonospora zingiberis]